MQRTFTLFALFCLSLVLGGCSLIGAGIGSAIPRYESFDGASVGSRVRLETPEGASIEGTVTNASSDSVVVAAPERTYELPLDRVRRRSGSHAGTGALIGGLIDLACVVAGTIVIGTAMSNMHGSLLGGWGNTGSFSGGW